MGSVQRRMAEQAKVGVAGKPWLGRGKAALPRPPGRTFDKAAFLARAAAAGAPREISGAGMTVPRAPATPPAAGEAVVTPEGAVETGAVCPHCGKPIFIKSAP